MHTTMPTTKQAHSKDAAYWGGNGDWLVVASVHRDSDALARSNFRVFNHRLNALKAAEEWEADDCPVVVERSSHFLVGWVEYQLVNPECSEAVELAEELRAKLEGYPVLDEEDFSREENEEADLTWKNCYDEQERINYIRQHRNQFAFHDFADLLGCVRGRYFAGCAFELIN